MSAQTAINFSTSSIDAFSNLITQEDAENLVKLAISPDDELLNYKICPYSKEIMGLTGLHLKLTLETRKHGDSQNKALSFFVKTIPIAGTAQADNVSENGIFLKETKIWRELIPLMLKNYKGEAWGPKCYLVKGKHTLVFEDMGAEGFFNSTKFLNYDCAMSAVACIARFHASSMLAEEMLGGKSLVELYPNIFEESLYQRTGRNFQWFNVSVDYLIILADEMGLDSSRLYEVCNRVFDVGVPSRTKRNVLSHGDLWSNNLIFDEINRCRLVDFQRIRYAPLAHDPITFLYSSTSREFREKREADVINHYYETLQETLKCCGYRGREPSFAELKQGVKEQRLPALIIAAVTFQFILLDNKNVTMVMKNQEMYEEYLYKSRKPIIDKFMTQDRIFEKRIKDITREIVETSLRLKDFPKPT